MDIIIESLEIKCNNLDIYYFYDNMDTNKECLKKTISQRELLDAFENIKYKHNNNEIFDIEIEMIENRNYKGDIKEVKYTLKYNSLSEFIESIEMKDMNDTLIKIINNDRAR